MTFSHISLLVTTKSVVCKCILGAITYGMMSGSLRYGWSLVALNFAEPCQHFLFLFNMKYLMCLSLLKVMVIISADQSQLLWPWRRQGPLPKQCTFNSQNTKSVLHHNKSGHVRRVVSDTRREHGKPQRLMSITMFNFFLSRGWMCCFFQIQFTEKKSISCEFLH